MCVSNATQGCAWHATFTNCSSSINALYVAQRQVSWFLPRPLAARALASTSGFTGAAAAIDKLTQLTVPALKELYRAQRLKAGSHKADLVVRLAQ